MLYEKLKAQAFCEYEAALSKYHSLCESADQLYANIELQYSNASSLIKNISSILNSITNTSQDFSTDLGEIAHEVEAFKDIKYYREAIRNTYLDAFGEILRGVSSRWAFNHPGDKIDKWFDIVLLISRIGFQVFKIRELSKRTTFHLLQNLERIFGTCIRAAFRQ